MQNFLKPCPEATCSHSICARLRTFEEHERQFNFEISSSTKFEAVYEELSKDIDRLQLEKQGLQEDNNTLKGENEVYRVQRQELSKTNGLLKQTVVELESRLAKGVEEAKRQSASHQSALQALRKDHEQAQMKSNTEVETWGRKCEALQKATVELEEHNSDLAKCKLQSEKEIEELGIKVKELDSQLDELQKQKFDLTQNNTRLQCNIETLDKALTNSEKYLCTVREALQEEKDKVQILKQEKASSAFHKKWLDNEVAMNLLNIQECVQRVIHSYNADPLEIGQICGSPSRSEKATDPGDQSPHIEYQNSLTTTNAPPTPNSLIETKTKPAPQEDYSQGKPSLSSEIIGTEPVQTEFTFSRPPPLGPKRSSSQHAEGWTRGKARRCYDSYRPGALD